MRRSKEKIKEDEVKVWQAFARLEFRAITSDIRWYPANCWLPKKSKFLSIVVPHFPNNCLKSDSVSTNITASISPCRYSSVIKRPTVYRVFGVFLVDLCCWQMSELIRRKLLWRVDLYLNFQKHRINLNFSIAWWTSFEWHPNKGNREGTIDTLVTDKQ